MPSRSSRASSRSSVPASWRGDTGLVMNNRLCSARLDSDSANALQPGKRPAHTLNSYMVFHNGEFLAVGGHARVRNDQPQTNVQVLHNLLDLKMDPQCALEAPRWSHVPGTPPNVGYPEMLRLEQGFPEGSREGLGGQGSPRDRGGALGLRRRGAHREGSPPRHAHGPPPTRAGTATRWRW